jgi:hypothetical protein
MKPIYRLAWALPLLAGCTSSNSGPSRGDVDAGGGGDDGGPLTPSDDGGPLTQSDGGVPDTFAWAKAFAAGFGSDIMAMASDPSGVVVVGQITGWATFGATTLTAPDGSGNAFVAKLDPSGNVLWAKVATGSESAFEAVVIDPSGNIFVSGIDDGDTLSGGAPSSFTFAGTTVAPNLSGKIGGSSVSGAAGLVARLDTNGNLTWLKFAETTTAIDMGAVALSGTNVVVSGASNGSSAFGPGETLPITCTTATTECVFLAAYDAATGAAKWGVVAPSTPARGNGAANPHQVQMGVDGTGNVFLGIGSYFEGAGSTDDSELVVNKYDPTGALTWNKLFTAATAQPDLNGFTVDTSGNSYVLADSSPGLVLGSTTLDPNGSGTFLAKLDPTGSVTWAKTLDSSQAGTTGLALGASSVLTFGNGDDTASILPDTVVPMSLGRFDPATGSLSSSVVCGIAQARGKAVSINGTSTYVSGDGASPGVFGHVATTGAEDAGNGGLFVAKLK